MSKLNQSIKVWYRITWIIHEGISGVAIYYLEEDKNIASAKELDAKASALIRDKVWKVYRVSR